MTVNVLSGLPAVGSNVGAIQTFADPGAGSSFSTTVPAGKAWRIWGGSCHMAASSTSTNRTPTLTFADGTTTIYVASNGLDYNANANQTIVFYDQTAFQSGPPFMTGAGESWNVTTNPASLCFNPVGIRPIWLPSGVEISMLMYNIQAGDQVSDVTLLVEEADLSQTPTIDGLGAVKTFTSPAAGSGWSVTVPAGYRWRVWGGSCLYTASSVVASRYPSLLYQDGNDVLWMASQNHAPQANTAYTIAYYEAECDLTDLYINEYLPVGLRAIWLPAGAEIVGSFQNIDPADQVSQIGLLVEETVA